MHTRGSLLSESSETAGTLSTVAMGVTILAAEGKDAHSGTGWGGQGPGSETRDESADACG